MPSNKNKTSDHSAIAWAMLRISLGLVFLWAFMDKLLGLGFATCRDSKTNAVDILCSKAWVNEGSPTLGFLRFGTKGPLADFYQGLAGIAWIDWLFMLGLLFIGISLISGIALKIATVSGSLLLLMMWTATLLPDTNPLIDDHIVYILVLWGVYLSRSNARWSIRKWWLSRSLVKKLPILE